MVAILIHFIAERPWIVFVALGIAFYLSMMRLLILQRRKRRAYQTLDRLVEEEILKERDLKSVSLEGSKGFGLEAGWMVGYQSRVSDQTCSEGQCRLSV